MKTAKTLATKQPATRNKAMRHLQDAVALLDELIAANPDDLEGLMIADALLEQMTKDIKVVRAQAMHLALEALNAQPDRKAICSLGLLEMTATPKRNFDDDQVTTLLVVAAERAIDKANQYGDNAPRAAVKAIRSVLSKTEPKLTALKAYGVDPDSISTIEWTNRKVKVTPVTNQLPEAKPSISRPRKTA